MRITSNHLRQRVTFAWNNLDSFYLLSDPSELCERVSTHCAVGATASSPYCWEWTTLRLYDQRDIPHCKRRPGYSAHLDPKGEVEHPRSGTSTGPGMRAAIQAAQNRWRECSLPVISLSLIQDAFFP